jgi:hypothetical protein
MGKQWSRSQGNSPIHTQLELINWSYGNFKSCEKEVKSETLMDLIAKTCMRPTATELYRPTAGAARC